MITLYLIYLSFSFLIVYAWKDWYKALCGLIALIGVIEHPYMPKTMFGIPGFNLWNILLLSIVLSWFISKRREQLTWDMPKKVNVLLSIYVFFIILSFFRFIGEVGFTTYYVSDYLVNALKWIVPGLLLFHGCNSYSRYKWAMVGILTLYVLIALQVIRWMPLDLVTNADLLRERSLRIFDDRIGFHRVNVSVMLAGAFWVGASMLPLFKQKPVRMMLIGVCVILLVGQALTGGRAGYGSWVVVGMVFAFLRWRRLLLLGPMLILMIAIFVPATIERMTEGFTEESVDSSSHGLNEDSFDEYGFDLYTILAGRNVAWPYVIDKAMQKPFLGYGRKAMYTTGVSQLLRDEYNESFPHPHNAYLQWWFDNGLIGLIPLFWFYYVIVKHSVSLFKDSRNNIYIAAGGMVIALLFVQLIASVGSQSFYPREGVVGMWAAFGVMLRVFVERDKNITEIKNSKTNDVGQAAMYGRKLKASKIVKHKLWSYG